MWCNAKVDSCSDWEA